MAQLKWKSLFCVGFVFVVGCNDKEPTKVVVAAQQPATPPAEQVIRATTSGKGHRGKLPDEVGGSTTTVGGGSSSGRVGSGSGGSSSGGSSSGPGSAGGGTAKTSPPDWFPAKVDKQQAKARLDSIEAFHAATSKWVVRLAGKKLPAEADTAVREFIIDAVYRGLVNIQQVNPELAYLLAAYAETGDLTFEAPKKTDEQGGEFKKHRRGFFNRLVHLGKDGGQAIELDELATYGMLESALGWSAVLGLGIPRYKLVVPGEKGGQFSAAQQTQMHVVDDFEGRYARHAIFHEFLHKAGVSGLKDHDKLRCDKPEYQQDLVNACSALAWPSTALRSDRAEECREHKFEYPFVTLTREACRTCASGIQRDGWGEKHPKPKKIVIESVPERADPMGLSYCDHLTEIQTNPDVYLNALRALGLVEWGK